MAALYFITVFTLFLLASNAEEIKVKSGDDVSLQCQSPRDEAITVLEWSRPEPETDGYVFFVRENRPYDHYQHPSFHGRVQLRDPEMKDGDVSVILKNVTINDTGTYKCHVSVNSTELINTTINLKVEDSGHTAGNTWTEGDKDGNMGGHVGLVVGLSLAAGVIVVVGFVIFMIYKRNKKNSSLHPAEEAGDQQISKM
ncbi:myelin-oligodendrocyte glycoprotein-like isoform X2 [Thunnus thynnus]|uniref:myelin-oligodendrocyte glycoprotein-like isoform X1 n=1 Tax=Thunnus thynnus TaxID=8237 RepID=UPI0035276812